MTEIGAMIPLMPCPKIELHVHFEGTVQPETLLEIGRKNAIPLPAETVQGLRDLYRFRDFPHFIETWLLVSSALRTADDFRRTVVEYAAEAASYGCLYIEGILSPLRQARQGVEWDEVFGGYCDGIEEARELHGVEVRLTPDITRGAEPEEVELIVRHSIRYRDRGVVAVGLGGLEAEYPPELYEDAFRMALDAGLGSVPHAGEVAGPESIRGALDALKANRIRHGIRAVEDPELMRELAERGVVLDTCLVGNLRTGVVGTIHEHPLPQLVAAGVLCSLSTDDPAMFDTDLEREYQLAASLGLEPRAFYEAGLAGALCDDATRARLRAVGDAYDWAAHASSSPATARS
jgi:aminodeoxyfutalosine deaminase